MPEIRKLRPQFRREPHDNFRLTPRRLDILLYLWRRRLAHSAHFLTLYNSERVYKDLNGLHHNGYASRIEAQVALAALMSRRREGTLPLVYALDNAGARELSRWYGIPRGSINWTEKNERLQPWRLPHRLLITSAMLPFDMAARRGELRLIEPGPLPSLAPEPARSWQSPFRLEASADRNGRRVPLTIFTDNTFAIELPETRGELKLLFLEADCGTEPGERSDGLESDLSDFARKLVGYDAYALQGGHHEQFGLNNFRVLTVTTSARRAENLVTLAQRVTGRGLGRFLCTDREMLERYSGNILALPWKNGRGETVTLAG